MDYSKYKYKYKIFDYKKYKKTKKYKRIQIINTQLDVKSLRYNDRGINIREPIRQEKKCKQTS